MKAGETIFAPGSSGAVALCAACVFTLCAGLPTTARADVTDELLEIMKSKGDLTEEQYKSLKARHQKEKLEYVRRSEIKPEKKVPVALAKPDNAVPVAIKKDLDYADAPPHPPMKDDASSTSYVTALPKGVGIRIGNFELETKGDITAFAIEDTQQNRFIPIDGALLPSGKANDAFAVRGGLIPSSLQFEVRTNQEGFDIAAHFGMYVGGNDVYPDQFNANGPGSPIGLGTPGIDFRQAYGTIGTPAMGTMKFGRDIGLFASDAILFDLTVFGAGTPGNNAMPSAAGASMAV